MKVAPALLLAAVSCGEKPSPSNPIDTPPSSLPIATVEPVAATPPSAIATASAKRVTVSDRAIRTRMAEIGVTVVLPPDTEAIYDENYKRYVFRLSDDEQGSIELVSAPAPTNDAEAMALWSTELGRDEARLLEHGGGGVEPWWSVTTFKVRVGVEGRPGLHRLKRVSRVAGLLALANGRHARCGMALEFDVEGSPPPPSLEQAIGICKSLRPL